ncbi:hypothetical protein B0H11DRAFT_2218996 [Mycena galericulata]|nr:hypothetical protein B0H11DRAFT_2218996 [Mycena galericulata]
MSVILATGNGVDNEPIGSKPDGNWVFVGWFETDLRQKSGQTHVIPALIHRYYLANQNGTPLVVGGLGCPSRQFVFSYDLAGCFILFPRNYDNIKPAILSAGDEEMSVKGITDAIVKAE